jgi:hypothetical protein
MDVKSSVPIPNMKAALCHAHAKLENGNVLFRAALHQMNMPEETIHTFGENPADFTTFGTLPVADTDAISLFVEKLAQRYSPTLPVHEPFTHLSPFYAYRLWSDRVQAAAGIVLNPPRLSRVLPWGVPINITGNFTPPVKKGQPFVYGEIADLLENAGFCLPAQFSCKELTTKGYINDVLGEPPSYRFTTYGTRGEPVVLCVPVQKDAKKTNWFAAAFARRSLVQNGDIFTIPDEYYGSTQWGETIDILPYPPYARLDKLDYLFCLPDDAFAIRDGSGHFLCGHHNFHFLRKLGNIDFCGRDDLYIAPTLFTAENAIRIQSRLQRFLPECTWQIFQANKSLNSR